MAHIEHEIENVPIIKWMPLHSFDLNFEHHKTGQKGKCVLCTLKSIWTRLQVVKCVFTTYSARLANCLASSHNTLHRAKNVQVYFDCRLNSDVWLHLMKLLSRPRFMSCLRSTSRNLPSLPLTPGVKSTDLHTVDLVGLGFCRTKSAWILLGGPQFSSLSLHIVIYFIESWFIESNYVLLGDPLPGVSFMKIDVPMQD